MSAYKLYTSGPYKQRDGSAITASSTVIDGGVAKNISDGDNLSRSDWRLGNTQTPTALGGIDGSTASDITTLPNIGTIGTSLNGFVLLVYDGGIPSGMVVGSIIIFEHALFTRRAYRVLRFQGTDVEINQVASSAITLVTNLSSWKVDGTFAANYDAITVKPNDNLSHEKIHKVRSLRTYKVATAIRSGTYNIFTGDFGSTPSSANDFASMDQDGTDVPDDETKNMVGGYNIGGEITYKVGGRTATTNEYERKNT